MAWIVTIAIIVVIMLMALAVATWIAHRQVVRDELLPKLDTRTPIDPSKHRGRKRFHE